MARLNDGLPADILCGWTLSTYLFVLNWKSTAKPMFSSLDYYKPQNPLAWTPKP